MRYDWIIIGGGPAGYTAAIKAAHLGCKVLLFEEKELGGTCLNEGCIPTKSLVHSASLYHSLSLMEKNGIHAEGTYDPALMDQDTEASVLRLRKGIEGLLKGNGIEVIKGHAVVAEAHHAACNDTDYEADHILIAAGSRTVMPRIEGIEQADVLTSREALHLSNVPQNIVIIGGGVIGMEFAGIYADLEKKVTVIEMKDRILSEMDPEVSQNLTMLSRRRGITILTGKTVTKLEKNAVWMNDEKIECDAVLMAVGRCADAEKVSTPGLIEMDRGAIIVNSDFRTSLSDTYACGDCVKGIQLAHYAAACAGKIIETVSGREPEINLSAVPSCVYMEQEIATVGMSEAQAKDAGIAYKVGKYSMLGNSRSVIQKADRGFIKVICDENRYIVGAVMMCTNASDMIPLFTDAIVNHQTVDQLKSMIYPHPGFAEGIQEALEDIDHAAVHIIYRNNQG